MSNNRLMLFKKNRQIKNKQNLGPGLNKQVESWV